LSPKADTFGFGVREIPSPNNWHNLAGKTTLFPSVLRLARLVGRSDIAKHRASQLGRQVKLLANRIVELFVQSNAIGDLRFKDLFRGPVTGSQKLFNQLVESFRLANLDFDCSGSFHHIFSFGKSLENPSFWVRYFEKGRQFLPDAEDVGVSLPQKI
jgi:hypothetical protein